MVQDGLSARLGTTYIATFIDCILELEKFIFHCSAEDSISKQSTYVHSVNFFLGKNGKTSIFNKNSNFQIEMQKNKNKITEKVETLQIKRKNAIIHKNGFKAIMKKWKTPKRQQQITHHWSNVLFKRLLVSIIKLLQITLRWLCVHML